MTHMLEGRNILVTGGTGTIGSEIVREVLKFKPRTVRVLDIDENGLFELQQELRVHKHIRFLIGDVRDRARMERAIEGINIVFHAAALKHVGLCEDNPFEALQTNVLGTQNLIDVALEANVQKVIIISTDKAVDPTNTMGATKLLAERLAISASNYSGKRRTIFACVRFGNVLWSRGSVIPLFQRQIKNGGPVTVTEGDMTRFMMSTGKAVELVIRAAEMAKGGEIYILKMPAVKIREVAEVMIEELAPRFGFKAQDIKIRNRKKGMGEKECEYLMGVDEARKAVEMNDMFIVEKKGRAKSSSLSYSSRGGDFLGKKEIKDMIFAESYP